MYRQLSTLVLLIVFVTLVCAQDERAVELFNHAQSLHEKGELERAVPLYREVMGMLPESYEPRYQCAQALLGIDRPEAVREAAELLKDVIRLKPDLLRAYGLLADAQARSGSPEEAEKTLVKALGLAPEDASLKLQLADLLISRKAWKQARALLEPISERGSQEALLLLAVVLESERDFQSALQVYDRLISSNPASAAYISRRGMLRLRLKEYSEAVSDLSRAYTVSQDDETGLMLAEALLGAGRRDQARQLAEKLSASSNPVVRKQLPELLLAAGSQESAVAELERALTLDPQNIELMARLAELLTVSEPARAIDYWRRVLGRAERPEYVTGYASALLKAARFEEAVAEYHRSLKLKESYEARAGLGLALFKLERFAPAAEQFIVMARQRPEVAINYYFLGICFDRMGDLVQAEKAYVYFKQMADPRVNQLEVEKVDLRLPILRRQLEKARKK